MAGGSAFVHFAPKAFSRIKAAGPGKFRAKLNTRVPNKDLMGFAVVLFVAMLKSSQPRAQ
jgi:hypothetical protein